MSPTRSKPAGDPPVPCPWCSASVPPEAATCPSCGAALRDRAEGDVLGVTQIDPGAVSRLSRVKPGRFTSWLGGEPAAAEPELGGRVEPVSPEVRKEMLRLELAALDAEIKAKTEHLEAQRDLPVDDEPEPSEG